MRRDAARETLGGCGGSEVKKENLRLRMQYNVVTPIVHTGGRLHCTCSDVLQLTSLS